MKRDWGLRLPVPLYVRKGQNRKILRNFVTRRGMKGAGGTVRKSGHAGG